MTCGCDHVWQDACLRDWVSTREGSGCSEAPYRRGCSSVDGRRTAAVMLGREGAKQLEGGLCGVTNIRRIERTRKCVFPESCNSRSVWRFRHKAMKHRLAKLSAASLYSDFTTLYTHRCRPQYSTATQYMVAVNPRAPHTALGHALFTELLFLFVFEPHALNIFRATADMVAAESSPCSMHALLDIIIVHAFTVYDYRASFPFRFWIHATRDRAASVTWSWLRCCVLAAEVLSRVPQQYSICPRRPPIT